MNRAPPENREASTEVQVEPTAEHAELALREAVALMAPIVLWLLRNGVSYPAFVDMLKPVFVDVAREELLRSQNQPTQSALTLLSGVHRRDVRDLENAPRSGRRAAPRPSLAAQVLTRWLTDKRYRAPGGAPRVLPRAGAELSFEGLCRELSNDLHPRTVLDELLRLGHVQLDGEEVTIVAKSFVPSQQLEQMTSLFTAASADHIAAAVSNITTNKAKFLEQSLYADGLTSESIELLHRAAREIWQSAFESMSTQARGRVERDNDSDGNRRMRFGVYFYDEPAATPLARPAAKRTRAARGAKAASAPATRRKK